MQGGCAAAAWVLNNTDVLGVRNYPKFSGPQEIPESKSLSFETEIESRTATELRSAPPIEFNLKPIPRLNLI